MAILINRAPWNALIDDSGQNLDGTPWTKAQIKSVLLDPIDVALADVDDGTTKDAAQDALIAANTTTLVTDNSTGTLNNYTLPGRTKNTVWSWTGSADLTLTGLAGGVPGDRLTIKNMSTVANRKILLPYMSGASVNPFYNLVTGGPTPLAPSGWATYVFVASTWVLTAHEQGQWITRPFSAANYGAQAGTWTPASALRDAYYISGRTLHWSINVAGPLSLSATYLTIQNPTGAAFAAPVNGEVLLLLLAVPAGDVGFMYLQSTGLIVQRLNGSPFPVASITVTVTVIAEIL